MSSMRNAVARRNFKERAQPKDRERLGILEKRKDYTLRAKDYKEKTAKLKALKRKAQDRNPDEFSFSMMSTRTKDGIKIGDRGNVAMGVDVVKLLKTQDGGYVRTMLQQTRREIGRLSESVLVSGDVSSSPSATTKAVEVRAVGGAVGKKASHVLYADEDGGVDGVDFATRPTIYRTEPTDDDDDEEEEDDDDNNTSDHKPSIRRSSTKANKKIPHYEAVRTAELEKQKRRANRLEQAKRKRARAALVSKMDSLKNRERALATAEAELDVQRARMGNQPVGGVNKNGVKFRVRQRRR